MIRRRLRALFAILLVFMLLLAAITGGFAQQNTPDIFTYTVTAGDVLDLIGAFYDVDVDCIIRLNSLTLGQIIFPGDQLTISSDCPNYDGLAPVGNPRTVNLTAQSDNGGDLMAFVGAGDTLDGLARRYDVSLDAILIANDIHIDHILYVGDLIRIPSGTYAYGVTPPAQMIVAESEQGGGGDGTDNGDILYLVQPGDILDLIAAYYNLDLSCVISANSLVAPYVIYAGQVLRLPRSCPPYSGLSSAVPSQIGGLDVQLVPITLPPDGG